MRPHQTLSNHPACSTEDLELDCMLDQMSKYSDQGERVAAGFLEQFNTFCPAHQEKVDRIGRFARMMEAREDFCRTEATRLLDRARVAAGKVERTKSMVMVYLFSHELKKIEGPGIYPSRAEECSGIGQGKR